MDLNNIEICKKKNLQLFISTHSEHMIFAISKIIKQKIIPVDDIKVFYFSAKDNGLKSEVHPIPFTEEFEISEVPNIYDTIVKEFKDTMLK